MKKIILLALAVAIMAGCKKEKYKDEFYLRQITKEELESGTGSYYLAEQVGTNNFSSREYDIILTFKNGNMQSTVLKGTSIYTRAYYAYEIEGDSIYLTHDDSYYGIRYYTLYIQFIHWGFEKTQTIKTGGEQIQFKGDNIPWGIEPGYYDENPISWF